MKLLNRATWAAERVIGAMSRGAATVARAARTVVPSIILTQYAPQTQSTWSVSEILAALNDHEDGNFCESAKLAKAFGRDDRISACRGTRTRALVGKNGAKFELQPSKDGHQQRVESVKSRCQRVWDGACTETALTRILDDYIQIGVSISRIHWTRIDSEWVPRLEPWDMQWVRWDDWRRCFVAQTQQGEVEVRPDTGEWLIVGDDWMTGGVRALAMAFYFRSMTWKDWARYCEKHGVPILAIEEPPTEKNAATGQKGIKETFFQSLKRMGREGILRLPRTEDGKAGFNAKIVEPTTLSWPAFEAFLKRLDVCIAIYLLGQNLSTEVQGGSLAAVVSQNRVRLDYLSADAEILATAIRTQLFFFWGRFNVETWDDDLAPWPHWDTTEAEDQKAKSTVLVNVANALEKLKKNESPVDERALLEDYEVPMLTPEEWEKVLEERRTAAAEAMKQAQQQAAPKTDDVSGAVRHELDALRELMDAHAARFDDVDRGFAKIASAQVSVTDRVDEALSKVTSLADTIASRSHERESGT